jgi:hypothetical protein
MVSELFAHVCRDFATPGREAKNHSSLGGSND